MTTDKAPLTPQGLVDDVKTCFKEHAALRDENQSLRELIQDLAGPIQHYFPTSGLEIYNLKMRVQAVLQQKESK